MEKICARGSAVCYNRGPTDSNCFALAHRTKNIFGQRRNMRVLADSFLVNMRTLHVSRDHERQTGPLVAIG